MAIAKKFCSFIQGWQVSTMSSLNRGLNWFKEHFLSKRQLCAWIDEMAHHLIISACLLT